MKEVEVDTQGWNLNDVSPIKDIILAKNRFATLTGTRAQVLLLTREDSEKLGAYGCRISNDPTWTAPENCCGLRCVIREGKTAVA